jgi:exodeoxyribonuclease VII small subunit
MTSSTTSGATGSTTSETELTYEQARAALEDVVRRLEAGGVPLEESLALWEQGEHLAQQCQQWLDGARARMQAVRENADSGNDYDQAASGGPAAG